MNILYRTFATLLVVLLTSCADMDGYRDFIQDGEITYTGMAIDLDAYPGNGRALIKYGLASNPNINKTIVYWGGKQDSVVIEFDRAAMETDTMYYIIDNLPESSYGFEVYNFDKLGFKSVPANVTCRVYGERYRSTLYDRSLLNATSINQLGDIKIIWGDSIMTSVGMELKYTNRSDEVVELFLANDQSEIVLTDCQAEKPLLYRSLYVPEETCIDTFYTDYQSYRLDNLFMQMDRTKFSEYRMDNDAPVIQGEIKNLWDGLACTELTDDFYNQVNFACFHAGTETTVPASFTVDLGVSAQIYQFKVNLYWPYTGGCPKIYELWGYTGEGEPSKSGDWSEWTKLGTLDNSQTNNSAGYFNGDNLFLEKDASPKVRYIRVKALESWRGRGEISISEISVWSYLN